ncbi:extracellular solute-binding protein [Herbidospora yilanensis]|uniref:extracellular solute-binding protein n=1 Tax=Herbidospora yilanensis TaxID=354426 RepID=UPI0009FF8B41|nr:extracellular solute-binding protein [Herbidospora yilanensis]
MTRRRRPVWPFVAGFALTIAFSGAMSFLNRAPAGGCPGNTDEITVAAGYDDSMDRTQRGLVNAWHDRGHTARYVEISRIPDEARAEMAATDQDGACPYDVLVLDVAHLAEFVANGYASPVELPHPASAFMAKSVAAGQIGGTQYGVPFAADVPLAYSIGATGELVSRIWGGEASGAKPPGQALTQLDDYEGAMVNLIEAIGPELVPLLSDPGDMPGGAELRAVAGPRLEAWRTALKTGLIDGDSLDHSEGDTLRAFRSARPPAPMVMRHWPSVFRSLWLDSRFRDAGGRLTFSYRPLPRGGVLGGSVLVISPKTRNRAAAESLVEHLTTPAVQAKLFACGSYAPVLAAAYEVSEYETRQFTEALTCLRGDAEEPESLVAEFGDFAQTVRRAMDGALLRPRVPYYSRLSETFRACALTVLRSAGPRDLRYYDEFADRLRAAAEGRLPGDGSDCG